MAPRGIPNNPKPKKTETIVKDLPDIDDLLEPDEPEEPEAPEVPEEPETVEDDDELDEEDAEIARLEAELKKPAKPKPAAKKSERPIPESKLTAKQKKLRDLQDQLARKKAAELDADTEVEYEDAEGDDVVVLHFVADGFIAQGQMWYRGQTVAFDRNGIAYEQTKDRNGDSWVDLVDDVDAQYERYGREIFRPGPWKGKSLAEAPIPPEIKDEAEREAYRAALKRAAEAEAKRGWAAPILSTTI